MVLLYMLSVSPARFLDQLQRLSLGVIVSDDHVDPLQVLVILKEVLDLVEDERRNVAQLLNVVIARVAVDHGQQLIILFYRYVCSINVI